MEKSENKKIKESKFKVALDVINLTIEMIEDLENYFSTIKKAIENKKDEYCEKMRKEIENEDKKEDEYYDESFMKPTLYEHFKKNTDAKDDLEINFISNDNRKPWYKENLKEFASIEVLKENTCCKNCVNNLKKISKFALIEENKKEGKKNNAKRN